MGRDSKNHTQKLDIEPKETPKPTFAGIGVSYIRDLFYSLHYKTILLIINYFAVNVVFTFTVTG